MESFLLADLRKIESALAVGDIEAAKIMLYVVITREESAEQNVQRIGGTCAVCGGLERDHVKLDHIYIPANR